jgi:hypothetical protein
MTIYMEACRIMTQYNSKLPARRFVQDLFEPALLQQNSLEKLKSLHTPVMLKKTRSKDLSRMDISLPSLDLDTTLKLSIPSLLDTKYSKVDNEKSSQSGGTAGPITAHTPGIQSSNPQTPASPSQSARASTRRTTSIIKRGFNADEISDT